MDNWKEKFKPAASARVHLLLAALMWSLVGTGLLSAGLYWSLRTGTAHLGLVLAAAAGLGLAKGHFMLNRTAGRIVDRIRHRGDGRCVGGFVSWRTWIFIASMMALGIILRHSPLPRRVVGFIYVAVGIALIAGAVTLWRALYRRRFEPAE
jgi:hypothetical protein